MNNTYVYILNLIMLCARSTFKGHLLLMISMHLRESQLYTCYDFGIIAERTDIIKVQKAYLFDTFFLNYSEQDITSCDGSIPYLTTDLTSEIVLS